MKIEELILNYRYTGDGVGKGTNINSVDKNELAVGIMVEKEHYKDYNHRMSISVDHLTENKKYYSILMKTGLVDERDAVKVYNKLFKEKGELSSLGESTDFRLDRVIQEAVQEILNEETESPEKLEIEDENKYKYYLTYDDSTHFYMSNDPNKKGQPYHVGQIRGEIYEPKVKEWLSVITKDKMK